MKHTKRILSIILALVMVFALCAPALADRSYEPYKYYMCVGDSIAAGCALTKDGSETYFDQETDDYTTPAAACAPLNSGIFSKAFTTITTRPVPGATPILIPTATVPLRSPILMRLTQW